MSDDWSAANCRTIDPNSMQPEHATPEDVAEAIAVCGKGTEHECPLLPQCRELAESQHVSVDVTAYGVHAGEWWGTGAKRARACAWCGGSFHSVGAGRPSSYCADRCKAEAAEARRVARLFA